MRLPVPSARGLAAPAQLTYTCTMTDTGWETGFAAVYQRGVAAYRQGRTSPATFLGPEDVRFLGAAGCTAQELFDFVEDAVNYGEPSYADALAVTSLRRDYFLRVLGGKPAGRIRSMSELPAKTDAIDGIAWLPRILQKAHAKLRGEMPADLMYGCGGDRMFLAGVRISLPEFLTAVRDAAGDDRAVVEWVKRRRAGVGEAFSPRPA